MAGVEATRKQRRVLVAVDESEESIYALSWALEYLLIGSDEETEQKDTVILLHAQSLPRVYTAVDGTAYIFSSDIVESIEKQQREHTESILQKAKGICSHKNIHVETKVAIGDPRDVICEQVEKLEADFLVIGSHGYGMIKRALLGSVSDYCVRYAKCPVVIVKQPKE
eukprot:Gb_26924 [translate_table: standard]